MALCSDKLGYCLGMPGYSYVPVAMTSPSAPWVWLLQRHPDGEAAQRDLAWHRGGRHTVKPTG